MIRQYIKTKSLISGYSAIFIVIILSISVTGYFTTYGNSEENLYPLDVEVDDENPYTYRPIGVSRGRTIQLGFHVNDTINFDLIFEDGYQQILETYMIESDQVIELQVPITGQVTINITSENATDVQLTMELKGAPSIIIEIIFICLAGIVASIAYQLVQSYIEINNRTKEADQLDETPSGLIRSETELSVVQQFRLSLRNETYFPIGLLFILFIFSYRDFESTFYTNINSNMSIENSFLNHFISEGIQELFILHTIGVIIILLPTLVDRFRDVTYTENLYGIDPVISRISQFIYVEGMFSFIFIFSRAFRIYDGLANGRPYQFPGLLIILSLLLLSYFACFTIIIITVAGIVTNEVVPIIISILLFSYPTFLGQNSSIPFLGVYLKLSTTRLELQELFLDVTLPIIFYFVTIIITALLVLYLYSRHYFRRLNLFQS